MKATQLKESLNSLIDLKVPVFIWGNPGIGKSSIVKQIAEQRQMEFIDLRLSLLDPTDLRGIPFFEGETRSAVWAKPEFLPPSNSLNEGILFLDEINSAPPTIQAAAYQLILDRKIGEYSLPINYSVVAAGNYETDRGITYKMPAPLANRFVHLYFDLHFEEWKLWAYENKIDEKIISYLSYKPDNLFTFDAKSNQKSFATPRSWEYVNTILKSNLKGELLKDVISGAIGFESAEEFMNYCKIVKDLPNIKAILSGESDKVPFNNSVLYALCTGLVYALKNNASINEISNAIEYSLNLPSEFSVMFIRDLQKEGVDVESSPAWRDWVNSNKFLME